jgi:hypothetical protein
MGEERGYVIGGSSFVKRMSSFNSAVSRREAQIFHIIAAILGT